MKKIVQQNDPILRKIAKEVRREDISSPKIKTVIKEMFQSLATQKDGVALAAPQIGYSKRIFVISSHVLNADTSIPLIYINPTIIKRSRDRKNMEEGCLSCRWLYGKTKRSSRTTIEAFDEHGIPFKIEGTGLLAQIFQHETDHLDGILFIDHAKELREIEPEN